MTSPGREPPKGQRVLLIGAGFMGARAAETLRHAGHRVSVLTRGRRAVPEGVESIVADRRDGTSLARALEGKRFDATIDFLAYDAGDIERLLLVPYAALGRLIMISTGQVYLVTRAARTPYREDDTGAEITPEPPEGTPDHAEWSYGVGKRRAEEALYVLRRTHGVRATALRLPIVLGEGDGSLRLWSYIQRVRDGGPVLLPSDAGANLRFIHAEDVARAIVRLVEGRPPRHFAYNLTQPDVVSLRELIVRIGRVVGVEPALVDVSRADLEKAGIARAFSPFGTPWASYMDPSRAASEWAFEATRLDDYLPGVVRRHLERPPESSHAGYVHRTAERDLAARLAGVR